MTHSRWEISIGNVIGSTRNRQLFYTNGYMLGVEDCLKDLDAAYKTGEGGELHSDYFEALDLLRHTMSETLKSARRTWEHLNDLRDLQEEEPRDVP